ncbi:MAG: hypothetical protein K6E59_03695 [Bacilli bacterium]|nr:hypothetical protein [Bacilli bacterium]
MRPRMELLPFHIIDIPETIPEEYSPRFPRPFTCKEDAYAACGEAMEAVQEWENEYRRYLAERVDTADALRCMTLGSLTEELMNIGDITGYQQQLIYQVVSARNKFVHTALLQHRLHVDYEEVRAQLNYFLFAVTDCIDVVANLRDGGSRPTIFDDPKKREDP